MHKNQGCQKRIFDSLYFFAHFFQQLHIAGLFFAFLQKAARYIRSSYREDIDLTAISQIVNLSPSYFSKKFKASTGFGYREYLVPVRIQAASAMLLETNKSIAEIALVCGFRDSNYFGDAFKREKGVSPSAYRKNNNDTSSSAVQDGIPRRD